MSSFQEEVTQASEQINASFAPIVDAWKRIAEQVALKNNCKMRRFYLVRSVDATGVSGTGVVAEGLIFEDGVVSMRWKTATRSTSLYASIEDVLEIHGHNGKTVVRLVD